MRPGVSISCRTAFIVTLLPQPDSPTIPTTWPGRTSKLTPSTARTVPSSSSKTTRRSRTASSGSIRSPLSAAVGIGGIAQSVAHQVERENGNDHHEPRDEQPGRQRQRLDILCLLRQHAPADRRRSDPEAQEGQRGFADDQHRNSERAGGDDMAQKGRQHVPQYDPSLTAYRK